MDHEILEKYMYKQPIENHFKGLAFPLHEILGLPESADLQVEHVSGPTTALTLRVTVPGEPDASYFVKTLKEGTGPGPHLSLGLREVRFYALIDSLSPEPYPNIPRCIHRHIRKDDANYYLVLRDYSTTHQSHENVNFESLQPWRTALAALADFHRGFTQKLSADRIRSLGDDRQQVESYVSKLAEAYETFRRDHREVLDGEILDLLQRSIPLIRDSELEKAERVQKNELTTILNRDAHLKNFLYPRKENRQALIVDWQFWGLGIGAFDLRHLLGSALGPTLRMRQAELVRHYYDAYRDGLDVDYSWADCWNDYRKGIIDNLFMPVWQYTGFGWAYERWKGTLMAAVENYHALDCAQVAL